VTIRENTEGEYSGLEHEVVPGVVESLKVGPAAALVPAAGRPRHRLLLHGCLLLHRPAAR
jgi:hypothetical protein